MKKNLFTVSLVLLFASCAPAPTATPLPLPTATMTVTQTPVPTATATSLPTATATVTATPVSQAQIKKATPLYAGPATDGFDTVAQLTQGMSVTLLSIFGDFVQVRAEINGVAKSGFVPVEFLSSHPTGLPPLSSDQVPSLVVKDYTESGSLTYSNSGEGWTTKTIDQNWMPQAPFKLKIQLTGKGESNYVAIYGRDWQRGDWWDGINRVVIGLWQETTLFVNVFDGTSANPCYNQGTPKPADGLVEVEFDDKGKHIVVQASGRPVIQIDDVAKWCALPQGVFPNGITHTEISSGPQSSMTISQLALLQVPDGKYMVAPTPTPTALPTPIGGGTGRIALVSDREGRQGVYSMNLDGTDVRVLARIPEGSSGLNFLWSPDGAHVALGFWNMNGLKDPKSCNMGVYLANADGSGVRNLMTSCATSGPSAWTPDGQRIGYTVAAVSSQAVQGSNIFTLKPDGSEVTLLTNFEGRNTFPSWSPDGSKIVFQSDKDDRNPNFCDLPRNPPCKYQIYVMNADGSNIVRLTTGSGNNQRYPAWSPDGKNIAFTSNRDGQAEIYLMNPDGSNQRRLTKGLGDTYLPQWSPDGAKIMFYAGGDIFGGNLYVINSNGAGLVQLTDSGKDRWAQWSPDGKMILFTSTRDGKEQIYVMSADGSRQRRVSDPNSAEWAASWQPATKK